MKKLLAIIFALAAPLAVFVQEAAAANAPSAAFTDGVDVQDTSDYLPFNDELPQGSADDENVSELPADLSDLPLLALADGAEEQGSGDYMAFRSESPLASVGGESLVNVTNELSTEPMVFVGNDGAGNGGQWGFAEERTLRDAVRAEAETADGRAAFAGEVSVNLAWKDRANASILNFSPRWQFGMAQSAFGARLKPFDFLEVTVTSGKLKQVFGPRIRWESNVLARQISIVGITGTGDRLFDNHEAADGVYAAYTGIEGLWLGGGIAAGAFSHLEISGLVYELYDGGSFVKKGAWGPFQLGAKYTAESFEVGAKWVGQFGKFDGVATESTDKRWQRHDVYAGFTYKGLESAKFPTVLGVAAEFYSACASELSPFWLKTTAFALSASLRTDFNNGISDELAVTVGYKAIDGVKTKVLPFYVGNTLCYENAGGMRFELYAAYEQMGLPSRLEGYAAPQSTDVASLVVVKPSFSYTAGRHTFSFGVDTRVYNSLSHYAKTNSDWAYNTLHGEFATVSLPISWVYRF